MPYFSPADPSPSSSSTTPTTSHVRPAHRRTRSSFSDERGPGAFVSMGNLPRRRNPSESNKRAVFHLNVDDDSPQDDDHSPSSSPVVRAASLPSVNSLRLSMESGRFSPTVNPPSHIELPKTSAAFSTAAPGDSPELSNVPFPTSSPLSPTDRRSPFIPDCPDRTHSRSTASSASLPRTPSTPIILSNGKPLKPSLKSSSSSPNVVGDFADGMRRHCRAQSAPSTPRVHFAEKDAGLETVKVFNRTGKPASLSKPAGEETETETEAEYPFPSLFPTSAFGGTFLSAGSQSSGASSPSQIIHELDMTPGVTSPIPNPNPSPHANIHIETVTLPRTRPPTLRGTVLVRNIHFEKNVVVRFTLDDWQTTSEVVCKHVVSLPGLPPPFPQAHTIGDYAGQIAEGRGDAGCPQWDRFSFTIRLEDYEPKLSERTLFLVARFVACNGFMGEYWDNNAGSNYRIGFRRVAAPPPSPLAAPRAPLPIQASASFPPSFSREKKSASFSAVPHVSTFGPARYAAVSAAAHKQQPTFSPPSAMRITPTTAQQQQHRVPVAPVLTPVAVANGRVVVPAADEDEEDEKMKTKEVAVVPVAFVPVPVAAAPPSPPLAAEDDEQNEEGDETPAPTPKCEDRTPPLLRRHSAPEHSPRFPAPPPIVTRHAREPAGSTSGGAPKSPVESYIAKKLTLRNYVAPGSRPASAAASPELPKAALPAATPERSASASPNGIVTPPTTPPRETHLKGLPDVAAEREQEKEDAQAMLSPLVMSGGHPDASPFSPTSGADIKPWAMSSLGAALTQLASPPVSRQGSREGSADNSGAPTPAGSGRSSPKLDTSDSGYAAGRSAESSSTSEATSPVSLPQHASDGTKVGTDDSSYAAFVKQWCFAQSTPPATGAASPAALSSAQTPAPTPPPLASHTMGSNMGSNMGVGMGFMGLSSFGALGNGSGARRQQAWPAEHQVGVGSAMGFGPGYGFAQAPRAGAAAERDGPGMGVVGGELVF